MKVARDWFSKAANSGHTDAQYSMGNFSLYGLGGEQNYSQALNWFTKASEGWDRNAQYHLGMMYKEGWGTDKDLVEAYKWFDLSAASGHVDAHFMRSAVASELTKQQVEKAHQMAQEWFDANHDTPHKHYGLTPHAH